eukprot:701853-Rhodomonas_salina.4
MSTGMSTDGQASSGPGVPLKAPEAVDVLEVRQSRQVGGVFGIGIKVNTDPPHAVQNVSNLTDPDGTNISSLVKIGDELWAVDGIPTEQESMDVVEGLILGKKDSLVKLTLKKKETGRTEELIVKRHVAVRTWDEPLTWLELREDLLGQNFLADSVCHPAFAWHRGGVGRDPRIGGGQGGACEGSVEGRQRARHGPRPPPRLGDVGQHVSDVSSEPQQGSIHGEHRIASNVEFADTV